MDNPNEIAGVTPEKNKGGAPSKLTFETKDRVFTAIKRGATYELAANYAGITYTTLRNWIKKGEEQEVLAEGDDTYVGDEFFEFFKALKAAEGTAAVAWLAVIDKAAKGGQWQAAAWKLERRYPQQYGKTVQELQGKDGAPIEFANLSPDERDRRINEILTAARNRRINAADGSSGPGVENMETATRAADTGVLQQS